MNCAFWTCIVILMKTENCHCNAEQELLFWTIWEEVTAILYEWFWKFPASVNTEVECVTMAAVDVGIMLQFIRVKLTVLVVSVTKRMHKCHIQMLLLYFLISSSCFRSPKLVSDSWKPLSRCVAHISSKFINSIFLLTWSSVLFCWKHEKFETFNHETDGWSREISWTIHVSSTADLLLFLFCYMTVVE
jgi:hypothetical protein